MNESLDIVEPLAFQLTGRARVRNAMQGVVPTAIAMPFIIGAWSPTWFVVLWVAVYASLSIMFGVLVYRRPSSVLEQAWSTSDAVLFATLPISAAAWSDDPAHFWAAVTVAMVFIAFTASALPFLPIDEWRLGVLIIGVAIVVSGFFVVHPVIPIAFSLVLLTFVQATDRVRKLKLRLEESLNAAQKTILHDPLTGLLNRRGLASVFEQLRGQDITLALIDVDRFKAINDTHGHHVGDQVLGALAVELRERLRGQAYIARLGGDEFVAVLPGVVWLDDSVAERLHATVELHGRSLDLECGLSIGIASGPNHPSHRLLSKAGFAMREAKRHGEAIARFGRELEVRLDRTLEITALTHGATNDGALVAVAQAIVRDERIVGCELLIRWRRADGTTLLPHQFLPMVVEGGLSASINEVMLANAVRFASRFNNRPEAPFVSVNISAPYLGEARFVETVHALLNKYRVPPARLMLEITETEQFGGRGGWEDAAAELRALGVLLAMDDFGTGYSSIERLQQLPLSHLKFDQSLVRTVSGPFGQILRGVAGFANAVGIGTIAEGIETLDEYESMRALGVSGFQGFLFHRPESLDDFEVRVIENRARLEEELSADRDGSDSRRPG